MLFALGAPIAVAFDDDGLCVMQKSIQQSGCHGGVTGEDSWPVFEGDVGGNDNGAALVAFCNGGTCMTKANSWREPPHQPTAKPLSSSCYLPIQNKNQSRRRTFSVEVQRKKMPDPEEDPPGPSAQKSAFKPVDSDHF